MLAIIFFLCATTGFEYLTIDPIAHRAGMGYAQFGDGYSVHYNPGGLAYGFNPRYSACYLNYIADTHFGYLGYERNQIGVGVRYFNGGSIKKTDEFGQEFGSFGVHFIDINLGKGFFINDIGVGFSLKGVYENIDTLSSLGIGVDVGAIYVISDPEVQIGCAVKNIGYGVTPFIDTRESFPYELDVGVYRHFADGWFGLDFVKPALMGAGVRVGAGYTVNSLFEIKASYTSLLSSMRTGTNGLDFLAGLTAGFAMYVGSLCIDYTYSPYFDLGGGHRISVSLGG
jgi:hypothetical protein